MLSKPSLWFVWNLLRSTAYTRRQRFRTTLRKLLIYRGIFPPYTTPDSIEHNAESSIKQFINSHAVALSPALLRMWQQLVRSPLRTPLPKTLTGGRQIETSLFRDSSGRLHIRTVLTTPRLLSPYVTRLTLLSPASSRSNRGSRVHIRPQAWASATVPVWQKICSSVRYREFHRMFADRQTACRPQRCLRSGVQRLLDWQRMMASALGTWMPT